MPYWLTNQHWRPLALFSIFTNHNFINRPLDTSGHECGHYWLIFDWLYFSVQHCLMICFLGKIHCSDYRPWWTNCRKSICTSTQTRVCRYEVIIIIILSKLNQFSSFIRVYVYKLSKNNTSFCNEYFGRMAFFNMTSYICVIR